MKHSGRNITFLASKAEMKLLEDAHQYGADILDVLDAAESEKGRWKLSFSYEQLDDFVGFLVQDANPDESAKIKKKLDLLCNRIGKLLELSDHLREKASTHGIATLSSPDFNNLVFDVWLFGEKNAKIVRKIQIAGTKSLYHFAKIITKAFGFCFDHCFAFQERLEKGSFKGRVFELFVDIGEEPTSPEARGVQKVRIEEAFRNPGERMIFLFDYGDNWNFFVELKEVKQAEQWNLKPVVLESIGKAPMQYPPCEADE
jgi:Plasmid pRiA4b ORF-3-like protein